jgi:hypothetical protein
MTSRKEIEDTKQNVAGLAMMARKLGYTSPGFEQLHFNNGASATNLFDFLGDNPGAIEAIIDWVLAEGLDSNGEPLTDDDESDESDPDEDDTAGDETV